MNEVLNYYMPEIKKSKILSRLKIESNNYFLVSCHREENVDNDNNFKKLVSSLNEVAKEYKLPIIFPIHPRTRKNYIKSGLKLDNLVKLIEPLGFLDYNKLQMNSKVVLSDSGTIFEESSILNFRALNIRESHERPEAIETASVVITGLNHSKILQGIILLEDQSIGNNRNIELVDDYSISNISIKVERLILSYIDYVNRVVWQKES
jgi:UDP-N-acetylglucosamine 2-epimerase (non-hydrolysing)